MGQLYKNYILKKRKFSTGGDIDFLRAQDLDRDDEDGTQYGYKFNKQEALGFATTLGTQLLNSGNEPGMYSPYKAGSQSFKLGATGAIEGAQQGFKTFGPLGAAAGAVIGGGVGYLQGNKMEKERLKQLGTLNSQYREQVAAQQQFGAQQNANYFADTKKAQMYGNGGQLLPPPIVDNTAVHQLTPQVKRPLVLNTPEYYTKKRNQKLISGFLNTGAAIAPPGASSAFDAAGVVYDLGTEGETNPVGIVLKNNRKVIVDKTAKEIEYKTVPGLGRLWNAYEAYENFSDASKYQDSLNMTKQKKAMGGPLSQNLLANQKAIGGSMSPMSKDTTLAIGPSHEEGGIDLPTQGAQVEGGETTDKNYVFSKVLGFADLHKPIAKAQGKIENKPATPERIEALNRLQQKTEKLKTLQEYFKQQLNLQ